MLLTPSEIVTSAKAVQELNAYSPRFVTLSGIVTPVTVLIPENACAPIPVTGRPVIVEGISTVPAGPMYPVIVMLPALVTKLKSDAGAAICV